MGMLILRRLIVVLWVMVAIYMVVGAVTALYNWDTLEVGVSDVINLLVILAIPTTLSYILFGVINPFKLWQYT